MGRYILVASELDDASALTLIAKYLKNINRSGTKIISIVGGAASGKSTLAKNLVGFLGNADTISTDAFGLGSREYRREFLEGRKPLEKYDFNLLREKVEAIKNLQSGELEPVPTYDEESGNALKIDFDKVSGKIVSVNKDDYTKKVGKVDYFIVEGDFQPLDDQDFCIYMHLPDAARLKNRIFRDSESRSVSNPNQIVKSFKLRQKMQHEKYTLPASSRSDMLIIVSPRAVENQLKYSYSIFVSKGSI